MCEKALKDAQHKFSSMWGLNNFTQNNNTIQYLVRTCMPIPVLSTLHIWFSSSYKYMTGAMLTAFHLRQWRHRGIKSIYPQLISGLRGQLQNPQS